MNEEEGERREKINRPRWSEESGIWNQHAGAGEGKSTQKKQIHEFSLLHVRHTISWNTGGLARDFHAPLFPGQLGSPCGLHRRSLG